MKNKMDQILIWYLRHKISLPVILAIVFITISLLINQLFIRPLKPHFLDLSNTTQTDETAKLEFPISKKINSPQQQLDVFYSNFPNQGLMTGQVQQLFDTAKASDLLLENGSYAFTPSEGNKLARCEVQLPLKGSYVQVQAFVANVLHRIPNIAVSAVDIKRQKISDTVVDSQIRFTLYYRES